MTYLFQKDIYIFQVYLILFTKNKELIQKTFQEYFKKYKTIFILLISFKGSYNKGKKKLPLLPVFLTFSSREPVYSQQVTIKNEKKIAT